MYTQCPECLTVYRVGPHPVAEGRGRLRCGHCGGVFDALATLTEQLPETGFQTLPSRHAAEMPPVLSVAAMHPEAGDKPQAINRNGRTEPKLPGEWLAETDLSELSTEQADRAQFSARPLHDETEPKVERRPREPRPFRVPAKGTSSAAAARPSVAPGAAREWVVPPPEAIVRTAPAPSNERPSAAWGWACILLTMLLAGQLLYVEHEALLANDKVRPWLVDGCARIGCQVPLPRDLRGLNLLKREVRPHENLAGALQISATMHNGGKLPAPFPLVEVRLADLNDRVIAMRRFRPEEYLADPSVISSGFPVDSNTPLLFEVADPGQEALAFEFKFLLP